MDFSVFALLAAFGGGCFAAAIGGVESFVFTGIFAILGSALSMGGVEIGGTIVGSIAFGPFFVPAVAFTGAVGAAAYAKKRGYMENGADIVTCLSTLNQADVILVGGVVGVIGWICLQVVGAVISGPHLGTDNPGFVVFWGAVIIRLVFGGKLFTGDKFISQGKALTNMLAMSVTFSILVAGVFCYVVNAMGADAAAGFIANYNVFVFGIAAVGLLFACGGQGYYGHHQIFIISAFGAMKAFGATGNLMTAFIVGVIAGTCAGILNDVETCTINSGTDSHIDGPGFAIFIMTFVLIAIFG
ncbi:MAG: hypothetical protein Q4E53_10435 [Eubacteriales bacterium]|nr:hypothetical protein [Eubacteriales bacterium]